jgi:hypothetical protein
VAQQHGVNFQILQEASNGNELQQRIFVDKVLAALWTNTDSMGRSASYQEKERIVLFA